MSVLELNHVKKSFNNGTLHVLKDISLSVEKGEVVAIIGPSGSGKSTLLRCATLLERIDSGEVCFDGHYAARTGDDGAAVYADKAELKQIRNYFGLVFQQFNLFPHYSVLKNVMDAPICVQKRDRAEVEASARKTLEKMGLGDKADAYPCQLSGGQQQRVGGFRYRAGGGQRHAEHDRPRHAEQHPADGHGRDAPERPGRGKLAEPAHDRPRRGQQQLPVHEQRQRRPHGKPECERQRAAGKALHFRMQ